MTKLILTENELQTVLNALHHKAKCDEQLAEQSMKDSKELLGQPEPSPATVQLCKILKNQAVTMRQLATKIEESAEDV